MRHFYTVNLVVRVCCPIQITSTRKAKTRKATAKTALSKPGTIIFIGWPWVVLSARR